MSHVFGPIQSRRLGRSMGIDLVPHKTCNWNCVYCQLGRTIPLTNERRQYRSTQTVLSDFRRALHECREKVDWITFVGSGEPTLHIDLGHLIREIKDLTDIAVAVITNGSLLWDVDVEGEVAMADAVLPSLDAGDEAIYRAINRPHPDLTYDSLVRGLRGFRRYYKGKLWVEVMLVADMNDTEPALLDLAKALHDISPDEVHISTPFHATAEHWVRQPTAEATALAQAILGEKAKVLAPVSADVNLDKDRAAEAIADVITRHPLPEDEVRATFAGCLQDANEGVQRLGATGTLQRVYREGRWFWCPAGATYADAHVKKEKK
ncbi:MAG: radical SAM protein [Acidobacteriia bacterium]|nr:radical SAM protein [Terriglobia bacterium]